MENLNSAKIKVDLNGMHFGGSEQHRKPPPDLSLESKSEPFLPLVTSTYRSQRIASG